MPIYEYVCSSCAHRVDILHGVYDTGPSFCPACGAEGTMRKAIAAPAVHFKGSGWAKKDRSAASRANAGAKADGTDAKGGGADAGTADAKSDDAKDGAGSGDAKRGGDKTGGDKTGDGGGGQTDSDSRRGASSTPAAADPA